MKYFLRIIIIFSLYFYINTQEPSIVSKTSNLLKKIKRFSRKSIKLPNLKNIYDKHFFSKTDILKIAVKNLYSNKNQIPYDYNYLDLCKPANILRPKEGITELLTGQRMSYSNYYVYMDQNETCNLVCIKDFTKEEIEKYIWLIKRRYSATYYLDKLPSGYFKNKTNSETGEILYSINYFSGEQDNKYQVVNFYISAHSVKQSSDKECLNYEKFGTPFTTQTDEIINTNSNYTTDVISNSDTDIQNRIFNVLDEDVKRYYKNAELQELQPGNISFTYDVIFIKSNKSFSSRYDNYLNLNFRGKYHWGSLLISNILILILTMIIFFILSRTVRRDIDKYNQNISIGDNPVIDEFGWKQIASDVFRPPIHQKVLCAFIGTGFEIYCLIIISLILYLIGLIKPEIKLYMIDTIFICFFVFSIISGFVSTLIYKNNGGKEWVRNTIVTAMLCPFIALYILFIIRILLAFEKSNAGFKISQMAFLAGEKPWYLHLQYISWFIGIIPFFTFFIEFVYLMKSLWSFNVFYLASYFCLSLLFSIILTSEISIIYVFINLCYGDHKWWWKSFLVSASPALYVYIYSFIYFTQLGMTRFSAIVIYFLIMFLITIIIALVLGSFGTLLTFRFIYYIYSKIKVD